MSQPSSGSDPLGFAQTHWTIVLAATHGTDAERAKHALAELCRTYWFPLYAYARRRGETQHAAEDLTQGFFTSILTRDSLARVDRERGKFRAFLLSAFKNFLADEKDHARAQKRGGDRTVISLDGLDVEARYRLEPAHELSPDKLFDKQWALSVLERVLARLQGEWCGKEKGELFGMLQGTLTGERDVGYETIATRVGLSPAAVKSAAHRLRRRYRELLIEEISQTVGDPGEVEEEIRYLMSCL